MKNEASEFALAQQIAFARWPLTGFKCNVCGWLLCYFLRGRPTMRQCCKCRKQQSVLAGTVLHATKLSLSVWVLLAREYEKGVVPTSRAFASLAKVANSTAWALNHKVLAALALLAGKAPKAYPLVAWNVDCRSPAGPPLGPSATVTMRRLDCRFRRVRTCPRRVVVGLRVLGHCGVLGTTALTASIAQRCEPPPSGSNADALTTFLDREIRGRHRSVSLRWLPRWVAACCFLWSLQGTAVDWPATFIGARPTPLHRLRPDAPLSVVVPP